VVDFLGLQLGASQASASMLPLMSSIDSLLMKCQCTALATERSHTPQPPSRDGARAALLPAWRVRSTVHRVRLFSERR
jgi:hypothetical protein